MRRTCRGGTAKSTRPPSSPASPRTSPGSASTTLSTTVPSLSSPPLPLPLALAPAPLLALAALAPPSLAARLSCSSCSSSAAPLHHAVLTVCARCGACWALLWGAGDEVVNNIPPEMFFRGLLWRPHERYLIRGDSQSALAYRQARNPMARRIDRTGPDTDVAGADGYVTKLSGDADCQAGQ
eukprot:3853705-Rhodomonas_salina.2